jgi:phospholipase A1
MPEALLVLPTRYQLLGLTGRFVRFGVTHQSNSSDDPMSRSWNSIYTQFGFERGNLSLLVCPRARIQENPSKDDIPDVIRYTGYGDITAIYQMGNSIITVQARMDARQFIHHRYLEFSYSWPPQGLHQDHHRLR